VSRSLLLLVHRDPGEEAFAEALRLAVGQTLGVAEVRVVLSPSAAEALKPGAAALANEVRRYLDTLADLGVEVEIVDLDSAPGRERLADLMLESEAMVAW
jgi:hypothetical protein